jgi:hypothetical protein
LLADAENLARWNELAAIQLFQQHPGNTYADLVARADALALYLMSAVSVLADAEVKVAVMEADEEQSRISLQRYAAVLEACAASGEEPWSTQAQQALDGTAPPGS